MPKINVNKTVWYINQYAGSPEEANYGRPFYLSKSLNDIDVRCRVIASSYHHIMRKPVEIKDDFHSGAVEGIPYTWVKTPAYKGNGLARLKNMFSFAWQLWKNDLVEEQGLEKPDVIIISSVPPFHFLAGRKWAKKYNAKLIFEVRDIWPLTLTELLKIHPLHPLVLITGWIEKIAYKKSDHVVSLLPNAYLHMKTKGLTEKKFNYIPNGMLIKDKTINIASETEKKLKKLKDEGYFIVIYAGAHGPPNAMMQFVKSAEIIKKSHKKIALILIGDGVEKSDLITYAEMMKLDNVHFFTSVPHSEIAVILDVADICYAGGKNIKLYKYGISFNKIFEYMFAEKPIILTVDSPLNPVEMSGCGICIKSNSPEVLAEAILSISIKQASELTEIGLKGKEYLLKEHSYEILAKKYFKLLG